MKTTKAILRKISKAVLYVTLPLLITISFFPSTAQSDSTHSKSDSFVTLHEEAEIVEEEYQEPAWIGTFAIGLNIGHNLEINALSGTDKKGFSSTNSLDLGLNYYKEGASFQMTNELHYMIGLQKEGNQAGTYIQRTVDDLSTLHDFSISSKKNDKWNINLIAKVFTSALNIYDGDYLKDHNGLGQIQGFFNPYDVILAPGIKYQPNNFLRLSVSPYSVQLFGLTKQEIADTGFYTDVDDNGNYFKKVTTPLGAEFNIWYDRKVKKWLQMQYRVGISSNYFENLAKNGLLDGLFITKVKLISDMYLMHRGTLRGDFSNKPFKPNYVQTILLSYSKSV